MTHGETDGGPGDDVAPSGAGWIALLARPDPQIDPRQIETTCQEQIDQVRATLPVGLRVELVSPTTGEASHAGLLVSSPDPALLSDWIRDHGAAQTMQRLGDVGQAPVAIVTQGVLPSRRFPVSYVVTYTVPAANRASFQQWQPKIVAAHLDADGFVSAEYHAPLGVDEENWTIVVRFATEDALNTWRNSDRRTDLVGELETIVDDLEVRRAGLSWAGWFPQPQEDAPARPQRWKQALATILPLYPTVMLATTHLAPRLGGEGWGWPGWLVTFVVVTIAVATLTWLLMPTVTKILSPWLLPGPGQRTRDDVGWTLLVLAGLAGLLVLFATTR